MGFGVGRLSYGCYMGQFGPWHFVSWQHHQTKGPRLWGVPEVDMGLLPLGSQGIASLLTDSEARPVQVAPVWDSTGLILPF